MVKLKEQKMGARGFEAAIVGSPTGADHDIRDRLLVDCRGDCLRQTPEQQASTAFWHLKANCTNPVSGMLNIKQFGTEMEMALNGIYKGDAISVDLRLTGGNLDLTAYRAKDPSKTGFDPRSDELVWSRKVPFAQLHD
jgi:hypothetical protein